MVATELNAAPPWRCVDFISDLHLQAAEPLTFAAWQSYLGHTAADAVFMLGDLFEVWVGDDCLQPDSFEQHCSNVLNRASTHTRIFVMHGNRDFLLGARFMSASGCTPLSDPTVLALGNTRWLLTHGDSLCLDDVDYQRFRQVVRGSAWQDDFLAKPLSTRQAIAQTMRDQSETQKRGATLYADLDTDASVAAMEANSAQHMIHGHTHRPATHDLPNKRTRIVLSDWDQSAMPPRAEVLRLTQGADGQWTSSRLPLMATATNQA